VKPWNGAPGTRIDVRHLFYNTPVRRKFLKTTSTELGHVCEAVTRLALAYPTLHLTLKHNGKPVYEIPATTSLTDRIAMFFGAELSGALYDVSVERGPVRLHGYIADPSRDRGNAKMQYLFLNGRFIRDRTLSHALQDGFRGLLMVGRYAVSFLFLELPPDQVDVNVHPTKMEVRFRDAQALFHLVLSAVRGRLNAANLIPKLQPPEPIEPTFPQPPVSAEPVFDLPVPRPPTTDLIGDGQSSPLVERAPTYVLPPEMGSFAMPANGHRTGLALQIHDAYLVLETPDGMLVIDQHALHERILFEQFKRRLAAGQLEKQRLLIPEPVDLTAEQAARALESKAELAELGLEIEDFGGGTLLLSSYPTLLGKSPPAAILRDVVDHLAAQDRAPTRDVLLNDLMSLMACKAAVKAGDRLTPEQVAALLEQRHLARDAHHCPHGRPTSLLFSRKDLDKQFGRI
jgi:DNA mismatch repair protein MutL